MPTRAKKTEGCKHDGESVQLALVLSVQRFERTDISRNAQMCAGVYMLMRIAARYAGLVTSGEGLVRRWE